jgi:ribose/xylose/arabinose/galactoside ABC-type transport system permease subunit
MNYKAFFTKYGLILILIGIILISSFISPIFLNYQNLMNVIRQISMVAIISIGATIVLIIGGIDLSIGSTAVFSNVFFAGLVSYNGFPIWLAFLIAIIAGMGVGFFNGAITVSFGVPPFIVTLATMNALRGLAYIYTNGGVPISKVPEYFSWIGRGYIAFLPVPVVIMLVSFILFTIFLNFTKSGVYLYAVGGNENVARLSGINVKWIKILAYVIGGGLSAISGAILASRLNSGQPAAGGDLLFNAITAAVLGGTSLAGGEGTLRGTFIGAIIIGITINIMTLQNVIFFYQLVIQGFILLGAVILDVALKKR